MARKKKFSVEINTTFTKVVDVMAANEEEAIALVQDMLFDGAIEDGVSSEEPNTEICIH